MEGLNPKNRGLLSGGLDSSTVSGFSHDLLGHKAKLSRSVFMPRDMMRGNLRSPLITSKTDHSVYYLTPDNIGETLKKIAAYYDEPFGNSSALPAYYCAKFAEKGGGGHVCR